MEEVNKETLKEYIVGEFLRGEGPGAITPSTPLITGGVLDSMAVAKLISYLEDTYHIVIEAHEIDFEHFDNLSAIESFVKSKVESETGG